MSSRGPRFSVAYSTNEDSRLRPFQLRRQLLPWADSQGRSRQAGRDCAGQRARWRKLGARAEGLLQRGCVVLQMPLGSGAGRRHRPGPLQPHPPRLRFGASRHHAAELRHQPGLHSANGHAQRRPHAAQASSAPRKDKLHIGDKDGKSTIVNKADVDSISPSAAVDHARRPLEEIRGRSRPATCSRFCSPGAAVDARGLRRRREAAETADGGRSQRDSRRLRQTRPRRRGPSASCSSTVRRIMASASTITRRGRRRGPNCSASADNIEVVTAMEWPRRKEFQKADAMVFFQRGNWDAKRAADIDAFLERGGGLTYIHWAVDGRDDVPGFREAHRPGRCGRQDASFATARSISTSTSRTSTRSPGTSRNCRWSMRATGS